MRVLICVPVMHNYADMGIHKVVALDPKKERYKLEMEIDALWDVIESEISILKLDYDNVQIYQDSWCFDNNIAQSYDFMHKGSRNHELIVEYIMKGALLMRTELYEMVAAYPFHLHCPRKESESEIFYILRLLKEFLIFMFFWEKLFKKYINTRDAYVADRIQNTLPAGKIGLMFMGGKHNVPKFISDKDIVIVRLPAVMNKIEFVRKKFNF